MLIIVALVAAAACYVSARVFGLKILNLLSKICIESGSAIGWAPAVVHDWESHSWGRPLRENAFALSPF